MVDHDLISLPELIQFEPAGLVECKSAEESLDELQSLNTALCFLCSINAVSTEIETFLTAHPEALLLEGTGNLPEESASFIVTEQINRCECFNEACNQNRLKVLTVLNRGFEFYQSKNLRERASDTEDWLFYAEQLVTVERDIRTLRLEEMATRQRLLESAVEVRAIQDELDQIYKYEHKSALSMLACRTRNKSNDMFARRSVLEYQVNVASQNLQSVEREHKVLLKEIRHGRRMQFAMLKNAFEGCQRHVCAVTKPTKALSV